MIRASDLSSLAAQASLGRLAPAAAPIPLERPVGGGWFDHEPADGAISLRADGGARGLSVAQHAERVLAALRDGG